MPRPEIPIDWEQVDRMLEAGCMGTECASYFAMHPNTFYERVEKEHNVSFTEYLQLKRAKGNGMIKVKRFQKAMKGDNTMLIWLSKIRLGEKEESHVSNSIYLETIDYSKADIEIKE